VEEEAVAADLNLAERGDVSRSRAIAGMGFPGTERNTMRGEYPI
jgi:hypothetical protein